MEWQSVSRLIWFCLEANLRVSSSVHQKLTTVSNCSAASASSSKSASSSSSVMVFVFFCLNLLSGRTPSRLVLCSCSVTSPALHALLKLRITSRDVPSCFVFAGAHRAGSADSARRTVVFGRLSSVGTSPFMMPLQWSQLPNCLISPGYAIHTSYSFPSSRLCARGNPKRS